MTVGKRGAASVLAYLIHRVVEKDGLALEPVLDGQGDFAEVVLPERVLVPDNKLESAHCLSEREKDGEFESGILRGIHGVECSFDIRGLLSFAKKRDDYVAKGSNEATGIGKGRRHTDRSCRCCPWRGGPCSYRLEPSG